MTRSTIAAGLAGILLLAACDGAVQSNQKFSGSTNVSQSAFEHFHRTQDGSERRP